MTKQKYHHNSPDSRDSTNKAIDKFARQEQHSLPTKPEERDAERESIEKLPKEELRELLEDPNYSPRTHRLLNDVYDEKYSKEDAEKEVGSLSKEKLREFIIDPDTDSVYQMHAVNIYKRKFGNEILKDLTREKWIEQYQKEKLNVKNK